MKKLLLTLMAFAVAAALAAAAVVYAGLYDLSATDQHLAPTYRLLDFAMRRAIKQRAADIRVPPLDDEAVIRRGLAAYHDHCVQCHGAPGVAPEPFALGLTPAAANLVHTGRDWPAAEIFWVVKHGIKMTGMPAWEFRMNEADLWAIVAFVKELPALSPADYRRRLAAVDAHDHARDHAPAQPPTATAAGDAARGHAAIRQYGCPTCHEIPGVVGASAPVGPPLEGIGSRAFIAGVLRNEREHMVRWLRAPQEVSPLSAMPDLGVGAQDALDMAAYLETLK